MKRCPDCQTPNMDYETVCFRCGHSFETKAVQTEEAPQDEITVAKEQSDVVETAAEPTVISGHSVAVVEGVPVLNPQIVTQEMLSAQTDTEDPFPQIDPKTSPVLSPFPKEKAYEHASKSQLSSNRVINACKRLLGSHMMLWISIIASAEVLLCIADVVRKMTAGMLEFSAEQILQKYIVPEWQDVFSDALETIGIFSYGAFILVLLLAALSVTGLWMMYKNAHDRTIDGMRTAGLKLIRVSYGLQAVVFAVAGVCCLIGGAFLSMAFPSHTDMVATAYEQFVDAAIVVIPLVFGVLFLVSLLATILSLKLFQMVKTIEETVRTAVPDGNISFSVIVLDCLFLPIVIAITWAYGINTFSFMISALRVIITLQVAVMIVRYRRMMRSLQISHPIVYEQPIDSPTTED